MKEVVEPDVDRGQAWRVKRDFDRAIADFGEAIKLNTKFASAYRDRGLTWDLIGFDRGLKRTHVSAVGFDPLDGQVIHLGTEVGLYRSADGGDTFSQVLTTGYIGAVTPARSDPAIVYAAWHPQWNASAPHSC